MQARGSPRRTASCQSRYRHGVPWITTGRLPAICRKRGCRAENRSRPRRRFDLRKSPGLNLKFADFLDRLAFCGTIELSQRGSPKRRNRRTPARAPRLRDFGPARIWRRGQRNLDATGGTVERQGRLAPGLADSPQPAPPPELQAGLPVALNPARTRKTPRLRVWRQDRVSGFGGRQGGPREAAPIRYFQLYSW